MKDKIYGNSIFSPCKDCKDRHSGCHAECEEYKAFKSALAKAQVKEYKQKNAEHTATAHEIQSKKRTLKRQGKKI